MTNITFLSMNAIVKEDEPVPGSVDLIKRLVRQGRPFLILADDCSRSNTRVAEKLYEQGFPLLSAELFYTCLDAAVDILKHTYKAQNRIYVLANRTVKERIALEPFVTDSEPYDWVLIGPDKKSGLPEYNQALHALQQGARIIVLNDAWTTGANETEIGCRAVAAMLEGASGKKALSLGYSSTMLIKAALSHYRYAAKDVLFVSDRLDTEIASAQTAGLETMYLLPGPDTDLSNTVIHPTYIVDSLIGILR